MWSWIYPFLDRHRLSIRRRTHVGQNVSGHLQQTRIEFVETVSERFKPGGTLEGTPPSLRVNMDETAVFFEMTASTTINEKNARTVSIRGSGSNSRRLTACVACAENGTKLPLFLVFKGKPGATIEKALDKLLPPGVFGCCQEKGWMNERGCELWLEKVWKPYVASHPSSFLMLDEFKCHTQACFVRPLNDIGTDVEIIPGRYTCVLQPCDVGINKPLKDILRSQYNDWVVEKMIDLAADKNVPVPEREDIVPWIVVVWASIYEASIRNTFTSIGYGISHNEEPAADAQNAEAECEDQELDEGSYLIEEVEDCVLTIRL